MAKLRLAVDEPRYVPLIGRDIQPDELVEVPDDVYLAHVWPDTQWGVVEAPERVDPDPGEAFDPGKYTVEQVLTYLAGANDAERDRVLASERDGKGRVGILDAQ